MAHASSKGRPKRPPSFLKSFGRAAVARFDVVFTSVGINLLSLALPLVILQVYDRVVPEDSMETFAVLIVGILVVALIDFLLRHVRNHITAWSAARFEHATGQRAVDRLLGADIDSFEDTAASVHLDRLAAIEPLREFHSGQGLITIADIPFAIIFIALIWLIGGDLVFASLLVAAGAAIFAIVLGGRLDRAIRIRAGLDDERYNFIFQTLAGIHTIKGLGMEAQFLRQYERMMGPLAQAVERVAFLSSLGQSMTVTLSNLAMVATGALGSLLVVEGTISGGALIACVLLAGRAIQPLMRLVGLWVQTRSLRLAEERLDGLMSLPQERDHAIDSNRAPDQVGDIRLQDATVIRGSADFPVLSNVTLDIPKGSFVAVQGPVGGGKSALLDLLAGFIRVDSGRFTVNGVSADMIDPAKLRRRIGYAKQEVFLFRGTIQDNLTLFGDRRHLAKALEMAQRIGLDEVLALMPNGLATEVGDTASEILPGSVQQQISLVRTLAREPELLLLDEANSAFDMETDRLFRTLLESLKGKTTIVMITSRPSLIRLADLVVEVNQGRLRVTEERSTTSPPKASSAKASGAEGIAQ